MSPAHSLVHSRPLASKAALKRHPLPRVTGIPARQIRALWDGGVGGRGRAGRGKVVSSASFTVQKGGKYHSEGSPILGAQSDATLWDPVPKG